MKPSWSAFLSRDLHRQIFARSVLTPRESGVFA
jgi:hypothetical protein